VADLRQTNSPQDESAVADLCREWPKIIGERTLQRLKYWQIIADKLTKTGWSWS
jgi:hypothetical protein